MSNPIKPAGGQPANLPAETSATVNATAEAARLRKTIALADEAIRCAADHRSARHADGETMDETGARWSDAGEIEAAAKKCRKAARSALAGLKVFPDLWSAEKVTGKIQEARAAALGLKAIIDEAQRCNANRQIRIFARQIAAAVAADRANGGNSK
jgi:hypothetical protein